MSEMWAVLVLNVLVVLLPVSDTATLVHLSHAPEVIKSPLHVAQCRATCLLQMWSGDNTQGCLTHAHCSTCWKSCEQLELATTPTAHTPQDKDKAVTTICSTSQCTSSPGCQVACEFYSSLNDAQASTPVVATNSQNVLKISPALVQWPEHALATNKVTEPTPLVYVLIQQLPQSKWLQITQTTENFAKLPELFEDGLRSLRVLVVSPQGLVSIYQPEKDTITSTSSSVTTTTEAITTTTTITANDELQRSWNKMMKVDENYPSMHREMEEITGHHEEEREQVDLWDLKRLSLIHQKSLVIAELSWNGVKMSEEQEYLITWELDGGGLKGHLVTDSTTVSLSLWPDTLYHIQVELFEPNFEEGEQDSETVSGPLVLGLRGRSLPLIVDTSEASFPLLDKPSALSSQQLLSSSTFLAMGVAVVLVFGALALALTVRKLFSLRRSFSLEKHEKQLLQDTDDCEEKSFPRAAPSSSSLPPRILPLLLPSHGVAVISSGALVGDLGNKDPFSSCSPLNLNRHVGAVGGSPWWWHNNSPQRAPSP